MIVAFFDFDGTITKKDSFLEFVSFTHGKFKLYLGLLIHLNLVIKFLLHLDSGELLKEKLITYFYKSYSKASFEQLGVDFFNNKLPNIIYSEALERIEWHKNQGHKVVVVTASIKEWIKPWCNKLDINVISTEVEVIDNKLTGKLKTKNCNGKEKVNRIKKKYNLNDIEYSYAYGNSKGDKELLSIANEKFYRYFS